MQYVYHISANSATNRATLAVTPLGNAPGTNSRHLTLNDDHSLFAELRALVLRQAPLEEINALFVQVETLAAAVAEQQAEAEAQAQADANTPAPRQFVYDEETEVLTYGDVTIPKGVVEKVKLMISQGFSLTPIANFMERLLKNPSFRVREQLFAFLEFGEVPLTPNGTFLAYKAVRSNFYDIHSGKFYNGVGAVVTMQRSDVDDDPNRTCSAGLHVCSFKYLPSFSHADGHVMVCEVDPANVVSIPADYNNTKMRTCEYTVISEWEGYYDTARENSKHYLATASVMSGTNDEPFEIRVYADGYPEHEYDVVATATMRRQAYAEFNSAIDDRTPDEFVLITLVDTSKGDTVIDSIDGEGSYAENIDSDDDPYSDKQDSTPTGFIISRSKEPSEFLSEYGSFDNSTQAISFVVEENLLSTYETLHVISADGTYDPITLTQ